MPTYYSYSLLSGIKSSLHWLIQYSEITEIVPFQLKNVGFLAWKADFSANMVPSNVLSSTYFLGRTFFFSKIFLGDPPLIFLEVCPKFRSMERWREKFDFHIVSLQKKHFSADVELRSIVPNFVT